MLKNVTFESMGYLKADWDKIQADQVRLERPARR